MPTASTSTATWCEPCLTLACSCCALICAAAAAAAKRMQVGFSWSFTRETLLACELTELERLLSSRQEVLAMLHPLNSNKVARMMNQGAPAGTRVSSNAAEAGADQAQQQGLDPAEAALLLETGGTGALLSAAAQQEAEEALCSESEDGMDSEGEPAPYVAAAADAAGSKPRGRRSRADASGASSRIIRSPDVFAGLNLGLADSTVVTLEVGVVEVANLAPRSGWSQDLTHSLLSSAAAGNARGADSSSASTVLMETAKREDLPLPVVYVFCGAGGPGDKGFEVGLPTVPYCSLQSRAALRWSSIFCCCLLSHHSGSFLSLRSCVSCI